MESGAKTLQHHSVEIGRRDRFDQFSIALRTAHTD